MSSQIHGSGDPCHIFIKVCQAIQHAHQKGVMLYDLLAGRPPFDPKAFASAGVDEIRKQIREVDPPRPSARLRTLDDEERTTIAHLAIRGRQQVDPNSRPDGPRFSPDGNWVGALSLGGVLHLWRAPSGAEIEAAEKAQATSAAQPMSANPNPR